MQVQHLPSFRMCQVTGALGVLSTREKKSFKISFKAHFREYFLLMLRSTSKPFSCPFGTEPTPLELGASLLPGSASFPIVLLSHENVTSLDAKTFGIESKNLGQVGWGGFGMVGGGGGCRKKARFKKPNGGNLNIFFQRNFIANLTCDQCIFRFAW